MEIFVRSDENGSGRVCVFTDQNVSVFSINFGKRAAVKTQWAAIEIAKAAIAKFFEIETQDLKSETA